MHDRGMGSVSDLVALATELAHDDAFDLTQTLEELGPQLSAALRRIFDNDRPISAAIKMLLRLVPAAEKASFHALVKEVVSLLPIIRQQSLRPQTRPCSFRARSSSGVIQAKIFGCPEAKLRK
jgi:hypothetical protein